jgi:hypothetical protein
MKRSAPEGSAFALASAVMLAACGSGEVAGDPQPVGLPPPSGPSYYTLYGLPGPWSREGADHADFDRDSRACRDRSAAARREADAGSSAEDAYRAFLGCMEERRWARGVVSRKEVSRADAAVEGSAKP